MQPPLSIFSDSAFLDALRGPTPVPSRLGLTPSTKWSRRVAWQALSPCPSVASPVQGRVSPTPS
jgi:hypothetical protein